MPSAYPTRNAPSLTKTAKVWTQMSVRSSHTRIQTENRFEINQLIFSSYRLHSNSVTTWQPIRWRFIERHDGIRSTAEDRHSSNGCIACEELFASSPALARRCPHILTAYIHILQSVVVLVKPEYARHPRASLLGLAFVILVRTGPWLSLLLISSFV